MAADTPWRLQLLFIDTNYPFPVSLCFHGGRPCQINPFQTRICIQSSLNPTAAGQDIPKHGHLHVRMMVKHQKLKFLLYLIQPYFAHIMVISGIQEVDSGGFHKADSLLDGCLCLLITVTISALYISKLQPYSAQILVKFLVFIYARKIHDDNIVILKLFIIKHTDSRPVLSSCFYICFRILPKNTSSKTLPQ